MTSGTRMAIGGIVIASVFAYMARVAMTSDWQYYLTVDECYLSASSLMDDAPVRVNGTIVGGSLVNDVGAGQMRFDLCGEQHRIRVVHMGEVPDNLADKQQVVVEGRLRDASLLVSHAIFTRCASKYTSKPTDGEDRGPMRGATK
ncbi:MAG: cytochrome c maturation protein CcmE [Pirellulaceae bacterium]|nr:cytochrome c maturation protein CcmE [Planctomycetales bacterium]